MLSFHIAQWVGSPNICLTPHPSVSSKQLLDSPPPPISQNKHVADSPSLWMAYVILEWSQRLNVQKVENAHKIIIIYIKVEFVYASLQESAPDSASLLNLRKIDGGRV